MQLKILSWNIWYDGYFDQISEFLKSSNADIIGLQEVVPNDPSRDTIVYLKKLGYEHVLAPVLELKDGRIMSNAVFSKHGIVRSETYTLSKTESRKAIRADIKIGNTELHVFTTHLLHTHQQLSNIQLSQAETLLSVLPKSQTIVMGDFNATHESATIRKMRDGLVDTDPTETPTWSVYPEGCPICKRPEIDTRLDYIFTTQDIKTRSFTVGNSKGSDHLPISIIMDL
ncbi:MAG: endonuclease/exonuclease/phosphatase family protein [bacterium]|nr:endonuclease/exonuclease/phosphatase family protein [bacterium]